MANGIIQGCPSFQVLEHSNFWWALCEKFVFTPGGTTVLSALKQHSAGDLCQSTVGINKSS